VAEDMGKVINIVIASRARTIRPLKMLLVLVVISSLLWCQVKVP
jgi:hypothetical protein